MITGGDAREYLDALGTGFRRTVEEKCQQHRLQRWRPDTVLIVDVGSAAFGWLRSDEAWLNWLRQMTADGSSVEFAGVAACLTHLRATDLRGACLVRSDQDADTASEIVGLMQSLGFLAKIS